MSSRQNSSLQNNDTITQERDMFAYPWNRTAFSVAAVSLLVVTILLNSFIVHALQRLRVNSFVGRAMASIGVADSIRSAFITSAALVRVFQPQYTQVVFYSSLTGMMTTLTGLVVIVKTLALIADRLWTCYVLRKYSKVPVIVSPKTCVYTCWFVVGIVAWIPLVFPTKYKTTIGMFSCTIGNSTLAVVYTLLFRMFLSLASCICVVACYATIRKKSNSDPGTDTSLVLFYVRETVEDDPLLYKLRALSSSTKLIENKLTWCAIVYVLVTALADLCIHPLKIVLLYIDHDHIADISVLHFFMTSVTLFFRPLFLVVLSPAIRWSLHCKLSSRCRANPPNNDPFIANRQLGNLNLAYTNHNSTGDAMNLNSRLKFRLNVGGDGRSFHDDTDAVKDSIPPISYAVSIRNQPNVDQTSGSADGRCIDGYTAEASNDRYGNMEALEICVGENSNSSAQTKTDFFKETHGTLNMGRTRGLRQREIGKQCENKLLSPFERGKYNVDISTDAHGNMDSFRLSLPNNLKREKNLQHGEDTHGYNAEVSANAQGNVESVKLCVVEETDEPKERKTNEPQEKGAYKAQVATDFKGNIESVRLCMGNAPRSEDKKTNQIDNDKKERGGYTAEVSTDAHGQMKSVQVCMSDEDMKRKQHESGERVKDDYKSQFCSDPSGNMDTVRQGTCNETKSISKEKTTDKISGNRRHKTEISTKAHDSTSNECKAEISTCGNMESVRLFVGDEMNHSEKKTPDNSRYKAELSTNSTGKVKSVRVCTDDDQGKNCQSVKIYSHEESDHNADISTSIHGNVASESTCDNSRFDNLGYIHNEYKWGSLMPCAGDESDGKTNELNNKSKIKGSYKAEVATDSKGNIESVRLCKGIKPRSEEDKRVGDASDGKTNELNKKAKEKGSYKAEVATDSKGNIESVRLCKGIKPRSQGKPNAHDTNLESVNCQVTGESVGKTNKSKDKGPYKAEVATDSKGDIESVRLCKGIKPRSEDK